jgi:N-acetylglucosaminyldiphosphoundecaprenol N-acetyl-beta-D-mannosaminyltransferase
MISVLGIDMYDLDIATATKELVSIARSREPRANRCISATGAHGLVYARQHPEFRNVLSNFFWNLPDGMPAVWIGRIKGARQMKRCYGPAFFQRVMQSTSKTEVAHFLCGGKEGVAKELARNCAEKFGNSRIAGVYCPPFRELTEAEWIELGEQVQKSGADIVWIGLSTPKQEVFASKLRSYCNVHFIITVGAAFDFHTDRIKFAPRWMQNAGLEWMFRLISEPKRLYKRYFTIVPLFLFYGLADIAGYPYLKKKK